MEEKKRLRQQGRLRSKKFRLMKKVKREDDDQSEVIMRGAACSEDHVEEVSDEALNCNDSKDIDDDCFEESDELVSPTGEINFNASINLQRSPEKDVQSNLDEEGEFVQNYYEMHGSSSSEESSNDTDDDFTWPEIPQNNPPPEIEQLREFGQRLLQKDLDVLLGILRQRLLLTLPKSSKTFLRTVDAQYNILEMLDSKGKPGQFVYFSIRKGLEDCINPELHADRKIKLQLNADGIPLKQSGDDQFWIMSGKVYLIPDVYEVFAIQIFFGQSKPKSAEEYLEQFIDEINELQRDGITIGGVHMDVELMCFICDTPARAFLKNTLGHCGKEACERCEVVGVSVERRTVFPFTEAPERTDASFRCRRQPRHHNGPSPLLRIEPPINMILSFILDFMHLFCIRIVKKLLESLLNGNLNVRLDVRSRLELGRRLESIKTQIPVEFQRKTRSTSSIAKWKATELRFFLLYCGPVVLKNLLRDEIYNHFLLLHVASRILCSEELSRLYHAHAKLYLRSFFIALGDYYGPESQILNAHHLIHAADDVVSMGCNLSFVNAFKFESFLGQIKRKLRTPNRPLAQVCRRLYEKKTFTAKKNITIPCEIEILKIDNASADIIKFRYKEVIISNASPDNMILLKDGTIPSVRRIFFDDEILRLECQVWKKKKPLYLYPCSSEKFNIWNLYNEVSRNVKTFPATFICNKLVKLQLSFSEGGPKKLYVIPYLH